MVIETDPFTKTFDALWALAEASDVLNGYTDPNTLQPVKGLILPGNKIKFNELQVRDVIKDSVQDADLPELMLSTQGVTTANLTASSCHAAITRQYSWMVSTGDFRVNYRLFPVQFALFCAMANWAEILSALTWGGEKFVIKAALNPLIEGVSDATLNRGIRGWSSIWACTVDMKFSSSALRAFNNQHTL